MASVLGGGVVIDLEHSLMIEMLFFPLSSRTHRYFWSRRYIRSGSSLLDLTLCALSHSGMTAAICFSYTALLLIST